MEMTPVQDHKKAAFLEQFSKDEEVLLASLPHLNSSVKNALDELEIPHRRTESWKYTRVNKIINKEWKTGSSNAASSNSLFPNWEGSRVVLVNGFFREDLSTLKPEDGLVLTSMKDAIAQHGELVHQHCASLSAQNEELFEAHNLAFSKDGLFLYLSKNAVLQGSILLENHVSGQNISAQNRNLIILEQGAQLNMIVAHYGDQEDLIFSNDLSEVFVGENAQYTCDLVQNYHGEEQFAINTFWANQAKNSRFTLSTSTLQGNWVRNNVNVRVSGENCETNLYGTYQLRNKQHVDNHTMIDHKVPHCESNEHYKGILYDQSTGVFNGKVFVREDAQKTNAFQQNGNIVMSDNASMNSKPELEIYADDVKCSHGSTTGQFDEEAVFYLMARGISEQNARELLVKAFVGEVLEKIHHPEVKALFGEEE
jgi:Fe-S cluster assembly protein SufD